MTDDPLKHTPTCELDRDNRVMTREDEGERAVRESLRAEIVQLRAQCGGTCRYWEGRWRDEAAEVERLQAALERIDEWSRAYPLSVFPEPDLPRAAEVLKANGMTLDSISAYNMRHVVEGVGKIARDALPKK